MRIMGVGVWHGPVSVYVSEDVMLEGYETINGFLSFFFAFSDGSISPT